LIAQVMVTLANVSTGIGTGDTQGAPSGHAGDPPTEPLEGALLPPDEADPLELLEDTPVDTPVGAAGGIGTPLEVAFENEPPLLTTIPVA
jgi:hypothetical protein